MQILKIGFENDDKFSLNKVWAWWRGAQWIRKKYADDWHYATEVALEEQKLTKVKGKCILAFYFSFMKNMLDSSNCSPMAKMVEDSLSRNGILEDDTNTYVEGVYYQSINKPIEQRRKMEENTLTVVIFEEGDKGYEAIKALSKPYIWEA